MILFVAARAPGLQVSGLPLRTNKLQESTMIAFVLVILSSLLLVGQANNTTQPHIIFILADDLVSTGNSGCCCCLLLFYIFIYLFIYLFPCLSLKCQFTVRKEITMYKEIYFFKK